ncbi:MAG: hypothetical protein ACFFG0_05225 [Candidatus Thorarchaeota archaeon]
MEWNIRKDITKEILEKLYNEEHLGTRKIAEKLNASRSTIKRHMKLHGMKMRPEIRKTLYTAKLIPNKKQKEIIYGTLLGDSCLYKEKKCKSVRMSFSHSVKQIEYVKWLRKNLNNIITNKEIKLYKYKKGNISINTCSYSLHWFRDLYKIFYKNNRKTISQEVLDLLTPLSLAIWFMDDGCHCKSGTNLATCSFNYNEHILIQKWFITKYSIETKIYNVPYGSGYLLHFNSANLKKLIKLIEKYIIPSMRYKFNLNNSPQRLQRRIINKNDMIQSELIGNNKNIAEMSMSHVNTCSNKIEITNRLVENAWLQTRYHRVYKCALLISNNKTNS